MICLFACVVSSVFFNFFLYIYIYIYILRLHSTSPIVFIYPIHFASISPKSMFSRGLLLFLSHSADVLQAVTQEGINGVMFLYKLRTGSTACENYSRPSLIIKVKAWLFCSHSVDGCCYCVDSDVIHSITTGRGSEGIFFFFSPPHLRPKETPKQ
jgi:hypothetical protein